MQNVQVLKKYLLLSSIFFLTFRSMLITILTYTFINGSLLITMLFVSAGWKKRLAAFFVYSVILAMQISFSIFVVGNKDLNLFQTTCSIIMSYILLFFSFAIEQFIEIKNYHDEFFHYSTRTSMIEFGNISEFNHKIKKLHNRVEKVNEVMTRKNINQIISEITRHSSFSYINNGTLNQSYFDILENNMDDEAVYIILSDTGSAPSQVISIFTDKPYNHVSISFDRELKSLISYNGGERVNPPGLNSEMIQFLSKKEDAAIYVYKLNVSKKQKKKMIEKIKEINEQGSAYNLLGLALKKSFKPNIMYCSQFVYSLLKYGEVNYFEKNSNDVKPTDLIELDYERKLSFEYKIEF